MISTSIDSVQSPSGVKVYVVVPIAEVLITEGLHVPDKPLSETVGNDGGGTPKQNGPICVNTGIVTSLTVIEVVQLLTWQPSVMVHVIVELPIANDPLASLPLPLLFVAPVIWSHEIRSSLHH